MIEKAVEEGYTVIVMPGYAFGGAIKEAQDTYPDVKFVALDVSEYDIASEFYKKDASGNATDELLSADNQPHVSKNVYSAVYKEELCGYMAGYAAVKMGYKSLGFLGGMAVPAVQRYGYGFVQGVDAAAKELGLSDVKVNYVYGGQFSGDADITAAMDTWYKGGTQVVFACGGGIYSSAAEAAQKVGAKVIGVDVDQAGIIDSKYGDKMTVTSAMKGLAPTVKTMLTEIMAGNWDKYAGKVETLGLVSGDDPTQNYVQLPMDTTQWQVTELCTAILDETGRTPESLPNYSCRIPETWAGSGKTVGELQFWQQTGATIVAIHRNLDCIVSPGPCAELYAGDSIVYVGDGQAREAVRRFFA